MDRLPFIEVKEVNKSISAYDNYHDILSVVDLDGSLRISEQLKPGEFTSPIRLNALVIVMCQEGQARIKLDYADYTMQKNSFLSVMPSHILQTSIVSPDFKAVMIIVDHSFLEELRPENRSPSMSNYMQIRKNPHILLDQEETEHLIECSTILRNKIKLRSHFFHKELLLNAFMGYLLEMANILMSKKDSMVMPTFSRKEELMNQFLLLLMTHCKERHEVTFYAEKLFITPQYLSLVLKELSGKSANKWIDEALMLEAKILLKRPQTTVQQVADMLNFSDQSTFGKFFKKHMGISPMEFRKSGQDQ